MAYKTILCHLVADERNLARWEAAFGLARGDGAHVIGLYTIPPLIILGDAMMQVTPAIYEQYDAEAQAQADAAGTRFMEAARQNGVSAEWRIARGFPSEAIRVHGLYADLVVMGQAGDDFISTPGLDSTGSLAADAAIFAGRPVIYLPKSGSFPALGKRVLLAWNGSREAARALTDSLPLLRRAEAVHLLTAKLPSSTPAQDISTVLARHGVKVEMQNVESTDDASTGALLLREAAARRCDMLVMGVYGHSRMNEWAFGGVSRHVLRHATLPVMFSH